MLKSKLYNTSTKCVVGVWENKNPTKFLFKITFPNGEVEFMVNDISTFILDYGRLNKRNNFQCKFHLVKNKKMLKTMGLN